MTQVTQPYNLFAQTKQQYYPNSQNQQVIVPGNVQGETPEQFAAGKRAANSQSEGYGANPALPTQTVAQQQTGNKGNVGGWTMPQGSFSQGDKPQKTITNVDELAAAMGYTSPQEEDRLHKASLANQRILALGDALRHIGNLAGTINYAPSQQLNQPWAEEQSRYEKGKALRDKANQTYLAYKQAKEAQDAKQKQWEAEQKAKADQWNATFKFNAAKAAADLAEKQRQYDSNLAFNREKADTASKQWQMNYDQKEKHHRQSQSLGWYNAQTSRMNAENKGKESNEKNVVYSRRGYLTFPGATEHDLKNIYDNMYEWGKSRGYINENSLLAGISRDPFGGKKISDVSKREAVNRMVMEHDDAAVQLHHKHRGKWHEQKPNDKKGSYSQYIVQPQGTSTSGTDYSQYLRK